MIRAVVGKLHRPTYIPYTGWYASCMPASNRCMLLTFKLEKINCKRCRRFWIAKQREYY